MTRIRIPAPDIEADVTAEQVEAYLLRPGSGWTERNDPTGYFRVFERGADSARFPAKESAKDYAYWLGGCVDDIANAEGRHPSAVLADITGPARGVGGRVCAVGFDGPWLWGGCSPNDGRCSKPHGTKEE